MSQRSNLKLATKYIKSLSGVLILLGVGFLLLSGFYDWKGFIQNIGLVLSGAGVTTFILKFDLFEIVSSDEIRKSGIEMVRHGRNSMVEMIESIEEFMRKARPKEIDICGISMYSFFEPHSLYDLVLNLASEGYKFRIIFADPNSTELSFQEQVEHKPGALKSHIEYLSNKFSDHCRRHQSASIIRGNIKIGYSGLLPKVFIVRAGGKMFVSSYLHRGPHVSPTFMLSDVPNGFYSYYLQYIDDIVENCFTEYSI
ncbi:hypothetical protein F6V25_10665 [Oryzomonas japonica]|uniref:Uncharacterized protein n=1 Tax=Oryzomonas japonica TaxID=2603858 RepID=A0A7J4ZPY5_9BACT|nr:hypothetical protein [Oryzomonas japonica]KAB0665078.1 hypothetical protein F6V25_10665 [Oryzomonas japonica]